MSSTRSAFAIALILACFFLSGLAALLYETAWIRQFSIVFGTSELAVASVLATYMAGLALGAAIVGRFVSRIKRPILVYALLELGIALTALAVPYELSLARRLLVAFAGGQPAPPDSESTALLLFYLASTFLVIVIPTAFMGATLPLLTRYAVRTREQIGSRTGLLYTVNTAGAVAGTLTAAFVLLPWLGLAGTVYAGIAINLVVFALAVIVTTCVGNTGVDPVVPARRRRTGVRSSLDTAPEISLGTSMILPIMLVSGMVSFTYEVLWTRLLAHLLGGSMYAFATMLAGFLSGIVIGSAAASRLATTRQRAVIGLVIVQIGTAFLSMFIYLAMNSLPELVRAWSTADRNPTSTSALLSFAILLPATLCIGSTFPFAVRILAIDETDAAPASARIYTWNTMGAISGAILAGFVLIPWLEFSGTTRLAVAINLSLAAAAAWLFGIRRLPFFAVIVLLIGTLALFHPGPPEKLLRTSPYRASLSTGRIVFQAVGRSTTVLLLEENGTFRLRNNGLPEASILPKGARPSRLNTDEWLMAVPIIARPDAKSMLLIGFGGGVVVEHAPASIESIDVIELEPEVINANRAVASLRERDPLSDPRVHVVINDARGALALTDKRYDIIISQPSQPWTAGASHLFTREFLEQARGHLHPGGVFVQWMDANMMNETLFKSLGATILSVFEDVRLYQPVPDMIMFLSSNEPLAPELQAARTGKPFLSHPGEFAPLGLSRAEDLCVALALDREGLVRLCGGADENTDNRNILAMNALAVIGIHSMRPSVLKDLLAAHDPLTASSSTLFAGSLALIARRIARRLIAQGQADRGLRVAKAHLDPADLAFIEGVASVAQGRAAEGKQKFEKAVELNPDDAGARFELIQLLYPAELGDPRVDKLAESLPDPALAIIQASSKAAAGLWSQVAAFDERLAAGEPGDQYSVYRARLRASWRLYLNHPERRLQHAREALEIIDETLAYENDVVNLTLRFSAAVILDMPHTQVETADTIARVIDRMRAASDRNVQLIRYSVPLVLRDLARLRDDPRVPSRRVIEVANRLHAALQRSSGG